MNVWLRGVILAVVAVMPARAVIADERAANDADALQPRVEKLIEQLDSGNRQQRVLAEKGLMALGPDILPLLPPPELLPNVAVREAVRRIRIDLERAKAIQSVRPSRVTLKGELPLAEIVVAVAAQSGNAVELHGLTVEARRKRFDVAFEDVPFWEALDDLAARAELAYDRDADADRVVLIRRAADARREIAVAYSGPYRIAVTAAGTRPFPDSGPFRIVRVSYRVTAEPRLRPLFVKYRGGDFSAQTLDGKDLPPFSPDARPEIPLGEGGRRLSLHADFRVPVRAAVGTTAVDKLNFHGKLTVTTAAGAERIVFTDLNQAAGAARRRGGVTVRLETIEFRKAGDDGAKPASDWSARFRVIVSYDVGGPAFESHRTWIFHNLAYLQCEDGERVERDGIFHTALQTDGAVVVEYGFRNLTGGPDDYRFVYVAPTLIVNTPIEFDVPNIPLTTPAVERKQP